MEYRMKKYNKALLAFVGATVAFLANFGVELDPGAVNTINALVPGITALLVFAVPNKTDD